MRSLCALLLLTSVAIAEDVSIVPFSVEPEVAFQELNPEHCWFHPRAAAIPGMGKDGMPRVVMTLQKHLHVSDYYSGGWVMQTDDLGKTWTGPTEIPNLAWVHEDGGVVIAVADITPGWHAKTGKLLAIGCNVRYSPQGHQLKDIRRPSQTAYSVHDPEAGTWTKWQVLEMPDDDKFNMARCACAQWMVLPDGELLLPIYYSDGRDQASVTVCRCSFDGETIRYLRHGTEMSLDVERGLCEPSIIQFKDTYYLTIRNDQQGYVTTSKDGLNFEPIRPWTFDDGEELGSYNTQQHWLAHENGLFLVYTRRGANNDHMFRHRAPLFIAQVDPQRLCVLRDTEKVVVPERGVTLGNFGCNPVTSGQSWVTVGEYLADTTKKHPRGGDGSVWTSRILWEKPNGLVEE